MLESFNYYQYWDSIEFADSEIKDNEKWQQLTIFNNYLNNSKQYKDEINYIHDFICKLRK
jgi:hypothetical protein